MKILDNVQSARTIPDTVLDQWLGHIQTALAEVESRLTALLQPHVQVCCGLWHGCELYLRRPAEVGSKQKPFEAR
jgi:hypothetical protein